MTTQDREPIYDVVWPLAPAAAPAATLPVNNHIQGARVSKKVDAATAPH